MVCAIMLTRDRPELARRAVECFRTQTYENKRLLIWDNTVDPEQLDDYQEDDEAVVRVFASSSRTIGTLRNEAIGFWTEYPIIIHWDDDDYSHPNRIAEQVALLEASGADVVGYNEMLFWREGNSVPGADPQLWRDKPSEAWLYTHQTPKRPYALGTSLCYKRSTWERHNFANETQGVEDHWLREKNVVAVSSLHIGDELTGTADDGIADPRMIARIHSGNTSNGYHLDEYVAKGSMEWKRVPEWDSRVRESLK